MCGITGIFNFDPSKNVEQNVLRTMTDIINYRGPDGDGFYVDTNVGLGHRRLSIIDLSTGDQPMYSDDKNSVIVLNGEIYNYIEIKEELIKKGHKFKTTSDTEVVLKAYEEWGYECQNKFNGMWAFALWDRNKETLFLSRDRIGEKPLHYASYNNSFIFGSEIKSIFKYGVPKIPQLEFIELYSVFKSIPAPHTFFKDIKKLQPGHFILVDKNGFKEHKYWDLPAIDENNMLEDAKQVHERFTSLFEDSIKIRMRCDVPFGAFLSGGLDSASIVALMSNYSDHPINTFTIGYNESEFDESKLAELVAKKFNTKHHLGIVRSEDFDEVVKRIVHHYDEPFGDSSAIPTGYVSKFASEKVKMVLTGDGGDELLSGYPSYQGVKFAQRYQRFPRALQNALPGVLSGAAKVFKGRSRYTLNRYTDLFTTSSKEFNERLLDKQAKPGIDILRDLIDPSIKTWHANDFINEFMKDCTYKDDFYKQMYFNFKFDLPNDYLVKVDRMSMAYSIETRLPFLDHRLIEFMAGVHKKIKMVGWERKSILRNTIAKKLPEQLLTASKKGFRVPVREWLKENKNEHYLNELQSSPLFNGKIMEAIIKANKEGKNDNGNLLWSLIILNKSIN
jgi:asparagine synthase (glutamine-hydrolysing)